MPHQLYAFDLRAPLWDMCFFHGWATYFLVQSPINPHVTSLYFKGCARNWAMVIDLKEVQAHFCPQTNLPDSHKLPCWQNHARTPWLCLGFQMGLRKQGEPRAKVGMGLGLVMVILFVLHSQFTALDLDFLVLHWLSGLWLALQRAMSFWQGSVAPAGRKKPLCRAHDQPSLRNLVSEGGAEEARKRKASSLMIFPKHLMEMDFPNKAKTQLKGLVFATNPWLFHS